MKNFEVDRNFGFNKIKRNEGFNKNLENCKILNNYVNKDYKEKNDFNKNIGKNDFSISK